MNWYDVLPKFVKVFPHEYKRVLTANCRGGSQATMPPPGAGRFRRRLSVGKVTGIP